MTDITAAMVKELREKSGAGMMDCKKALAEVGGDMEAAIDWLRAKGIAKADKKSGRTAAEGLIGIASAGTKAVVLEINSETRMSRPAMNQILEMADFVKFAKVRPLPDDNVKVFNAAIKFVEATKPLPPAPAEAAQPPLNNPPK